MKYSRVLKLAEQYSLLCQGMSANLNIIPGSEFDSGTDQSSTIPEYQQYPSYYGNDPLPSYNTFQKHYQNTPINYNIIFTDKAFGINKGQVLSLDEYKSSLSNLNISQYFDDKGREDRYKMQVKYLNDNFDKLFNSQSINVIANKENDKDLSGPLGIDHDLGHVIMEDIIYEETRAKEFINSFINAFYTDYVVNLVEPIGNHKFKKFKLNNSFLDRNFALTALENIIAANNLIEGSISDMNIKSGIYSDMFYDLYIHYNKSRESLNPINVEGINLYSEDLDTISLKPFAGKHFEFIPKNEKSLSSLESVIRTFLKKVEDKTKISSKKLVGKVICLWDSKINNKS